MGGQNLNFAPAPFFLPLFFFIVLVLLVPIHAQDDVCAKVNCVGGSCVPRNGSILGFDCDCFDGWKKVQLGLVTLPTCLIPNCTLDFQCGNGDPPPFQLPPFDVTNPCNLVWCGEGTCVANGTDGYYCECNEGSANLLNLTALACFKQCAIGADCHGLQVGPHLKSKPTTNGLEKISMSWRSFDGSNMVFLSAILLALLF